MSTPTPLADAIHSALARLSPTQAASIIRDEAGAARTLIEVSMHATSALAFPEPTERLIAAMKLLRASTDHGRALVSLLQLNDTDFGVSAIILHRSQIEQFLRGAFFAFSATEAELEFFLRNDEMPSRLREGLERPVRVSPAEMAALVTDTMKLGSEKLIKMVKNAWKDLCGMSHGGTMLLRLYSGQQVEIGSQVGNGALLQIMDNTAAVTNMVLAATAKLSRNSEVEISEILQPVSVEWARYSTRIEARPEYAEKLAARRAATEAASADE